MSDGILGPSLQLAGLIALGGFLPAALITWLFGGRWVFRLWLLIMAGIAVALGWFFLIQENCCPTGMEGLALVIWPILGFGVGIGMFLGYAVGQVVKNGRKGG
ncbi:MAG: hypothetical protein AAFQ32_02460 [Pseudomonadota bacterium]